MRFGLVVAAAACALVLPASASALTFSDANYAVGSSPEDVAVGDFNHDGDPDLVVANRGSDSVSVLLGEPGGGFAPRQDYRKGSPEAIAVADFSDDGSPDVAAVGAKSLFVSLGHAGGGIGTGVFHNMGPQPNSIGVGDFDQDGRLDLAITDRQSDIVSVMQGQGGGFFRQPQNLAVGGTPTSVAVGDFNQDGDPDLVVARAGELSVFVGRSGLEFDPPQRVPVDNPPDAVAVDDFNQDGDPDVAVANANSDNVSVLLGEAGAAFGSRQDYATGNVPDDVTIGDFNSDGDPDLAIPNHASHTVTVYRGQAGGAFGGRQNFRTHEFPIATAVADFNRDGDADLAVANRVSNDVSVLLNTSAPVVSASPSSLTLPATPLGSTSARRDVTVKNTGEGGLSVASLGIAGEDADQFVISGETCTDARVRPGGSCTVGVRLKPTVDGPLTATLRIADNAGDSPQRVPLSGRGGDPPAPGFSADPSSLAFGNQAIRTSSAPKRVTVTNTGEGTLTIASTALGGANPGHFTITGDACAGTSVAPGATCTVDVAFRPTAAGRFAGALVFGDNAPGSPHAVELTGRGCRVIVGSMCL